MVGVEPTGDVCSVIHIDREVHIESVNGWWNISMMLLHIEIGECHQFLQSIVCGDRRVAQYVIEVCGRQYFQFATHLHLCQFAGQHTIEIDISLAISLRAARLLGVNDEHIISSHAQIDGYMVGIAKVYVAH